jgi:hypothetical protein
MDAKDGGLGSSEGQEEQGTTGDAAELGATKTAGTSGTAESSAKSRTGGDAAGTGGDAAGTGGDAAGTGSSSPAVRVSDRERDAVVQRVQTAFAEGRLDDTEFDERMRAALTARTRGNLDVLLTDLPAETAAPGPASATPGRGPGRLAIALKSSVRRGGRWRVPERYTTVVYKGTGWLDLRAAELSGPVTTFVAVAYKSRVTILVPPGLRVEMTGFGVTQGAVEITTRPPERPALHR